MSRGEEKPRPEVSRFSDSTDKNFESGSEGAAARKGRTADAGVAAATD